jgi:hypothetical protein
VSAVAVCSAVDPAAAAASLASGDTLAWASWAGRTWGEAAAWQSAAWGEVEEEVPSGAARM